MTNVLFSLVDSSNGRFYSRTYISPTAYPLNYSGSLVVGDSLTIISNEQFPTRTLSLVPNQYSIRHIGWDNSFTTEYYISVPETFGVGVLNAADIATGSYASGSWITMSYAQESAHALQADTASVAIFAISASSAAIAVSASFADTSSYSQNAADLAVIVTNVSNSVLNKVDYNQSDVHFLTPFHVDQIIQEVVRTYSDGGTSIYQDVNTTADIGFSGEVHIQFDFTGDTDNSDVGSSINFNFGGNSYSTYYDSEFGITLISINEDINLSDANFTITSSGRIAGTWSVTITQLGPVTHDKLVVNDSGSSLTGGLTVDEVTSSAVAMEDTKLTANGPQLILSRTNTEYAGISFLMNDGTGARLGGITGDAAEGSYIYVPSSYPILNVVDENNDPASVTALNLTSSISKTGFVDFTGATPDTHVEGRIFYDPVKKSLSVYNDLPDVTLNVGEEEWVRVVNKTGALITNGTVCTISGSQGNRPKVIPAISNQNGTENYSIIGVATMDIPINEEGIITTNGVVNGVDTRNWLEGDNLYVSSSAGLITNVKPSFPYDVIKVGTALNSTVNGSIFISPVPATHFHDISGDGQAFCTASWANNAISASNSLTASYIGSGTNNYFPIWNNNTLTSTSSLFQSASSIGIGTTLPSASLHVVGENNKKVAIFQGTDSNGYNTWFKCDTAGFLLGRNGNLGYLQAVNSAGTSAADFCCQTFASSKFGIGTNLPTAKLHISGSDSNESLLKVQNNTGTSSLFCSSSGWVGINTIAPRKHLDINVSNINEGLVVGSTYIGNSGFTAQPHAQFSYLGTQFAIIHVSNGQLILNSTTAQPINFRVNNSDIMTVTGSSGGRVGIGTATPTNKLDLAGGMVFSAAGSATAYGISRNANSELQFNGGSAGFIFNDTANGANLIKIDNTGSVSIGSGTVSAGNKLAVVGNISCSAVTASQARLGAGANYVQIDSDGSLTLQGSASCFEDIRVEPTVRGSGVTVPAFEKYFSSGSSNGCYLYSFADNHTAAQENEIFFTIQMPHARKSGSNIHLHVHWIPSIAGSGSVCWGLEYTMQAPGQVFGNTTFLYASQSAMPVVQDNPLVQSKHYITEFADIVPDTNQNGLSSIIVGRLFRNSSNTGADTYTNKVGMLYIDCHIEVDSMGSREEYTK